MNIKLPCLVVALLLSGAAGATPIKANTTTGLTSPAVTLTFDEIVLANDTVFTNQYASLGIASATGLFYNGCETVCVTTPPNGKHPDLTNFSRGATSTFNVSSSLTFTSAVNGAAFQFASNGGTFTFTALLNNVVVESFQNSGTSWGYYGFSGVTLDKIAISAPSAYILDVLQLGTAPSTVPEPASLLLVGLGMAALGFARRKRA